MPTLLAFEWDAREARAVVARTTGKAVEIEQIFAIPLSDTARETSETAANEAAGEVFCDEVGARLAAACRERDIGRCQTLVALPRAKAELRVLQAPLVPDDELPDLIRFQALRQFTSLGEDWPLDFTRLRSTDPQQVQVLAAAIPPGIVDEARRVGALFESPPTSLVLRPFAAASFCGRFTQADRCRLMVELFADEAELTVVAAGQAFLLRSVRLPTDDRAAALVGEIRRTLAAAHNQLGDHGVQAVTLLGGQSELGDLPEILREQLSLEVETFDPLAVARLSAAARQSVQEPSGRFAALLGMVYDEAEQRRHGIDFLKPRQRPAPVNRGRRYAVIGAAAAALLLIVGAMAAWQLRAYAQQSARLQAESQNLDASLKTAAKLQAEVELIDAFAIGGVDWLDELYTLAKKFPSADDSLVDTLTLTTRPEGGGQMYVEGYVRDPSIIEQMESRLRDRQHQVTGSGTTFDERQPEYRWQFKERITVQATGPEEAAHE